MHNCNSNEIINIFLILMLYEFYFILCLSWHLFEFCIVDNVPWNLTLSANETRKRVAEQREVHNTESCWIRVIKIYFTCKKDYSFSLSPITHHRRYTASMLNRISIHRLITSDWKGVGKNVAESTKLLPLPQRSSHWSGQFAVSVCYNEKRNILSFLRFLLFLRLLLLLLFLLLLLVMILFLYFCYKYSI